MKTRKTQTGAGSTSPAPDGSAVHVPQEKDRHAEELRILWDIHNRLGQLILRFREDLNDRRWIGRIEYAIQPDEDEDGNPPHPYYSPKTDMLEMVLAELEAIWTGERSPYEVEMERLSEGFAEEFAEYEKQNAHALAEERSDDSQQRVVGNSESEKGATK
jgi:hypothetical protein